jgi:hypothetical protein
MYITETSAKRAATLNLKPTSNVFKLISVVYYTPGEGYDYYCTSKPGLETDLWPITHSIITAFKFPSSDKWIEHKGY